LRTDPDYDLADPGHTPDTAERRLRGRELYVRSEVHDCQKRTYRGWTFNSQDDVQRIGLAASVKLTSLHHFHSTPSVSIRNCKRAAMKAGRESGSLTPWPPSSSSR
jgi:hypothetical protein